MLKVDFARNRLYEFRKNCFLLAEEKRQKRKEQQQQQLQQQQQQQVQQQPPQMRSVVPGTVPTRSVGTAPQMQATPQSGLPGHSPGKLECIACILLKQQNFT
jgi:transcription initiation factor TFIID subunit TAF12